MKKVTLLLVCLVILLTNCNPPEAAEIKSNKNELLEFSFNQFNPVIEGVINDSTITIELPFQTPIENLVATFIHNGEKVTVDNIEQQSGVTVNNYSSNVEYTVIAENGDSNIYTVVVNVLSKPAGFSDSLSDNSIQIDFTHCPGATSFPLWINDRGRGSCNAFSIAKTEVTYEQWEVIYNWATNGTSGTGAGLYTFANTGLMGDGNGDTNQHPVTSINWRDAYIFCNAATEYFNNANNTSMNCVYYSDAAFTTIVRTSSSDKSISANPGELDNPYINYNADGLRLPTSMEWECAARYINGIRWNSGDNVSGDTSGNIQTSTLVNDYSWNNNNSGNSTHIVGTKQANHLGIFDMAGNVTEWIDSSMIGIEAKGQRGGAYKNIFGNIDDIRIAHTNSFSIYSSYNWFGIRFVKTNF